MDSLHKAADIDSSISIGVLALKMARETSGSVDTSLVVIYRKLSNSYYVKAEYVNAENSKKKALEIIREIWGEDNIKWFSSLQGLADIYQAQAKYSEAEHGYLEALAGFEKICGPVHEKVAMVQNHLGQLYRRMGKLAEAEQLLARSLSLWEQIPEPPFFSRSQSYHQLALVFQQQGKVADAIPLEERAFELRVKGYGPDHYEVASSLKNLAIFHWQLGEYHEAVRLQRQSLATMEKILGPVHPWVALGLSDLAKMYISMGMFDEAEQSSLLALKIMNDALDRHHPDVALIHNILGVIYDRKAEYVKAERHFTAALQIREETLGKYHYHLAETLEDYSAMLRSRGSYSKALEMARQVCEIRRKNFVENAFVLQEIDALTYSEFLRKSVDNYLSCFYGLDSVEPSTKNDIANIVMSCKGQVSDEIFERQEALFKDADSISLDLMQDLKVAKLQLSQLYVRGSGRSINIYQDSFDSLVQRVEELETNLSNRSVSYRRHRDIKRINTDRISSLMPDNSVLIEYLRFEYSRSHSDDVCPQYLAIVLDNDGEISLIKLGQADEIEELVDRYRQHMVKMSKMVGLPADSDQREYTDIAHVLYARIWEPVENLTTGKELVFLAPDAGLNLIAFATLINGKGKYVIEEVPLHYLSAGRDLIRLHDVTQRGVGLFAIGDPDYNASVMERFDLSVNGRSNTPGAVTNPNLRNVFPECNQLANTEVAALPLSRYEIQEIVSAWEAVSDEPCVFYCGAEASEYRFKVGAPGHRVIHLATHGYYISDACSNQGIVPPGNRFVGDHPLLLSGLFLAGANLHEADADSASLDDGIITAYEISAMNFYGADMVVLSACETGLGSVREGEGVYGLRRAFQMAGARSVLSSLWAVSDRYTAKFMSKLYNRDEEIMPARIRELQLEAIRSLRLQGRPDHPVKWGAFILSGDWH